MQPSREELQQFYRRAVPRLKYDPLWFDSAMRQALSEAFAQVIAKRRYVVYACAILSNHAHLVIRSHKDRTQEMFGALTHETALAINSFPQIPSTHPIWSERPYFVLLHTPDEVRQRIKYVENNPLKEKLPRQRFPFVTPYDGWPLHRKVPLK